MHAWWGYVRCVCVLRWGNYMYGHDSYNPKPSRCNLKGEVIAIQSSSFILATMHTQLHTHTQLILKYMLKYCMNIHHFYSILHPKELSLVVTYNYLHSLIPRPLPPLGYETIITFSTSACEPISIVSFITHTSVGIFSTHT